MRSEGYLRGETILCNDAYLFFGSVNVSGIIDYAKQKWVVKHASISGRKQLLIILSLLLCKKAWRHSKSIIILYVLCLGVMLWLIWDSCYVFMWWFTFWRPSSLRLTMSRSKSVRRPVVLLKHRRPVRPSQWDLKEQREMFDNLNKPGLCNIQNLIENAISVLIKFPNLNSI